MICKKCERVDALNWLYMVRSNNDPSINEFIKGSEWRQIARTVWMSIQIYWLNFNKNEYIRIIFWYEWMSEYIRIKKLTRTNIRIYSYQKIDTNECPNIYSYQKYSNIRIYSSHSVSVWFWNPKTCFRIEKRLIFFGFCPQELNLYSVEFKVQEVEFTVLNSFQ